MSVLRRKPSTSRHLAMGRSTCGAVCQLFTSIQVSGFFYSLGTQLDCVSYPLVVKCGRVYELLPVEHK